MSLTTLGFSLNQYLFAIDDVQSANGLLYTLASQVIDDSGLLLSSSVDALYCCGRSGAEVEEFEVVKYNPFSSGGLNEDTYCGLVCTIAIELNSVVVNICSVVYSSLLGGFTVDGYERDTFFAIDLAVNFQCIVACRQDARQCLLDGAIREHGAIAQVSTN